MEDRRSTSYQREQGFSILEILFVTSLMGVLSAIALLQIGAAQPALKGDSAMRVILAQMRTARELAITQRRYIRVAFIAPNQMQIIREEVPGPATTVLATTTLEGGIGYELVEDVPDTPDAFGQDAAVHFGVVINVKFSPEGTLVNQDGQTSNGTVFLSLAQENRSARAVTVLGSTGRIRGYRWDGRSWKLV